MSIYRTQIVCATLLLLFGYGSLWRNTLVTIEYCGFLIDSTNRTQIHTCLCIELWLKCDVGILNWIWWAKKNSFCISLHLMRTKPKKIINWIRNLNWLRSMLFKHKLIMLTQNFFKIQMKVMLDVHWMMVMDLFSNHFQNCIHNGNVPLQFSLQSKEKTNLLNGRFSKQQSSNEHQASSSKNVCRRPLKCQHISGGYYHFRKWYRERCESKIASEFVDLLASEVR